MFSNLPVQAKKILFLETKEIAEFYMEEIYEHNIEFIIVTGDMTYPQDKEVRESVWKFIKEESKVQIVVLSKFSMQHLVNIKSRNVILLHDILEAQFKYNSQNKYTANYNLNLDKQQLAFLIHILLSLHDQNKYAMHPQSKVKNAYEVNGTSLKLRWESRLLYPHLSLKDFQVTIEEDWEVIKEYWGRTLWPDREDINSMSSMILTPVDIKKSGVDYATSNPFEIGYDMEVYEKYKPTFFVIKNGDEIIGVNSGHRVSDTHYRSRGLFVSKKYRGRKLGTILLNATVVQARKEGCEILWSLPRELSLPTYEKVGIIKKGFWIDEGVLYGPNCIAIKQL